MFNENIVIFCCIINFDSLPFAILWFKADEHESRSLEDIKEEEPEFFVRVTTVLKRAELEFGL